MRKWILVWFTTMVTVIVCVPALALWITGDGESVEETQLIPLEMDDGALIVPVFLSEEEKVVRIPLETYVRGVVAAEMPVAFEPEALKAQALVARTYIVRRMMKGDFSNVPVGAYVTDTIQHQAHLTEEQMKERWGAEQYTANLNKIHAAVNATKGQIITYKGEPINATFFSTSNGFTENSEDYWSVPEPYLRSVASPWDEISPKFEAVVRIPFEELGARLGVRLTLSAVQSGKSMQVIERSEGQRIKKIRIGNRTFTGREVREKLELNSSQFAWKVEGRDILFTTRGYGHGVGMSQYGAQGMALEGSSYQDIVKHYYQGVEITDMKHIQGIVVK